MKRPNIRQVYFGVAAMILVVASAITFRRCFFGVDFTDEGMYVAEA